MAKGKTINERNIIIEPIAKGSPVKICLIK